MAHKIDVTASDQEIQLESHHGVCFLFTISRRIFMLIKSLKSSVVTPPPRKIISSAGTVYDPVPYSELNQSQKVKSFIKSKRK